jgi:protein-S-isoprenylcysteine O-methyltransferase Ste14
MSNALELRIPPVALVFIAALAMWALAGVAEFRRARTTVNPTTPQASSSVVDSGIYRRSRNPMYLGFLLALAGWAIQLGHLAALPVLPAFVLYMNRFQIAPEERALRAKFGAPYAEYTRRVRRWL